MVEKEYEIREDARLADKQKHANILHASIMKVAQKDSSLTSGVDVVRQQVFCTRIEVCNIDTDSSN
jgi:hypothetical protein